MSSLNRFDSCSLVTDSRYQPGTQDSIKQGLQNRNNTFVPVYGHMVVNEYFHFPVKDLKVDPTQPLDNEHVKFNHHWCAKQEPILKNVEVIPCATAAEVDRKVASIPPPPDKKGKYEQKITGDFQFCGVSTTTFTTKLPPGSGSVKSIKLILVSPAMAPASVDAVVPLARPADQSTPQPKSPSVQATFLGYEGDFDETRYRKSDLQANQSDFDTAVEQDGGLATPVGQDDGLATPVVQDNALASPDGSSTPVIQDVDGSSTPVVQDVDGSSTPVVQDNGSATVDVLAAPVAPDTGSSSSLTGIESPMQNLSGLGSKPVSHLQSDLQMLSIECDQSPTVVQSPVTEVTSLDFDPETVDWDAVSLGDFNPETIWDVLHKYKLIIEPVDLHHLGELLHQTDRLFD